MNTECPTDEELDAMIGPPLEWRPLWAALDADPDRWRATTREMFDAMLGAVPPAAMGGNAFLCGEQFRFNAAGEEVFACFVDDFGAIQARYMTRREFAGFLAIRNTDHE